MSGLEAIAVIGVVAALVTAFRDSSSIASGIVQRRRNREGALPPTIELEETLAEGEEEIRRAAAAGIRRYGATFVEEDHEAKVALQSIIIEVQASMLRDLSIAVQDDNITDFTGVIDASTEARMKAVNILTGLYLKKMRQESSPEAGQHVQISESPVRVFEQPRSPSLQNSEPAAVPNQRQDAAPLLIPRDSEEMQRRPRNEVLPTNSRQRAGKREQPRGSWKQMFSGLTRSYVDEQTWKNMSSRSRAEPPPPEAARQWPASMSSTLGRVPPPYMLSPTPSFAEPRNPWFEARSMTDSDSRRSIHSMRSHHLNRRDTQLSTLTTQISPENDYGGFCEGAYHLQVGLIDSALKRKNESVSMTGQGQYYACRGKRCVFEGPAVQYQKGWSYDKNLRSRHELKYRWMFLAKSHIPQTRVRDRLYDFKCLICVLLGDQSSTFHGATNLLNHVAGHSGTQLVGVTLTGPIVIGSNSISEAKDDNFDINFLQESAPSLLDEISSSSASTRMSSDVVSMDEPYDTTSVFNPRWR